MTNQYRAIKETALRTGLTVKQVNAIIQSQFSLVKNAITTKRDVSVYIRGVGTFISPAVNYRLIGHRIAVSKARIAENKRQQMEVNPLEFN
jgi:nucleoid DNA-binding protein